MSGPPTGVSIVITSYNYGRFIGRTIASATAQQPENLEIVIVDNASTDNSWSIIQAAAERDPRIRAYRNDTNIGMIANHIRGLELATKERVLFLSADDYLLPGHIERLLHAHHEHPEIDYFFTSYIHVDEDDRLIRFLGHVGHTRGSYFGGRNEFADLLAYDCYACTPTTLFDREEMVVRGGFDHDIICGDYDTYLRLSASGKSFGFLDAAGVAVRIHANEITGEERFVATGKQFLEQLLLIERHLTDTNLHRIAGREQSVMNLVLAKINNLNRYPDVARPILADAQSRIDRLVALLNTSRQRHLSTALGARPRVSLVLCVGNELQANLTTLESIKEQEYDAFDLVLVTDTSHNLTPLFLDRLAGRNVRVMHHRGPFPFAVSLNDALALAQGEIVAYCKPGDKLSPGHLTQIAGHFSTAPIEALRLPGAGLTTFSHRRSVIDRFGKFDERLAQGADTEFMTRISTSVTTGTQTHA